MLKYLLIFTLLLNQLLAFNSIKLLDSPIVLCICDFGHKISLENGKCDCAIAFNQIDANVKISSLNQSIEQWRFELPMPSIDVSTKNFGCFDITNYINLNSFSKKSVLFNFFLGLNSNKYSGFSLRKLNYKLTTSSNCCQSTFILIDQPKIIIRC